MMVFGWILKIQIRNDSQRKPGPAMIEKIFGAAMVQAAPKTGMKTNKEKSSESWRQA
jgi:hypothetical protein